MMQPWGCGVISAAPAPHSAKVTAQGPICGMRAARGMGEAPSARRPESEA